MVEMEVRQEDHVDIDRINSCAHQLVCGAMRAIEQIVTLPYGDQNGGMVSIGINKSSSGSKQYHSHEGDSPRGQSD